MEKENNLKLWDEVEKTNPAHTKKVTLGRAITAIDPYYQIKNATEQFGPAGQGWGWEVRDVREFVTSEIAVLVRVWIKDKGHIEQWGQNGLYIDNAQKKKDTDHMKKATTDGLTKCLSCMGFNADVFLGKFDDNKYVNRMKEEFKEAPKPVEKKTLSIEGFNKTVKATNTKDIQFVLDGYKLDDDQKKLLTELIEKLNKDADNLN